MIKVCEDCTHNRYCGGEYVDEKGCFYKHVKDENGVVYPKPEEVNGDNKEEKEMRFVWPIIVIEDRYSGVYSGGKYTAWNMYPQDIPEEVNGDDTECQDFFSNPNLLYGRGGTPQEAIDDLVSMVNNGVHMPTKNKEEKEMKKEFDQYIKNVDVIEVEFMPEDSQIKLQVRSGEDIYLFLLEGEGAKIAAENYAKSGSRLVREKYELKAENGRLKKERDYLQVEKNRIEADRKRIIEEHKKSDDEQCDRYKALYDEFRQLKQDNDKNIKRNKELNKQIDEMVLNANKKVNTDEEPSSRRDILRCAEKCVCGKREQDYGTPESNFQIIADLWNGYLGGRTDNPVISVTPVDVSMMMALLKIARIRNGGGTGDSFVDLAGYAACGGEINAQKKATKTN